MSMLRLLAARPAAIVRLREHLHRSQFLKEEVSAWLSDLKSVKDVCALAGERITRQVRTGAGYPPGPPEYCQSMARTVRVHRGELFLSDDLHPSPLFLEAALQNFGPDEVLPPKSHISLNGDPQLVPGITPRLLSVWCTSSTWERSTRDTCVGFFHLPESEGEADNAECRIQSAIMQQKKADMLADACIAWMKNDIDESTRQQVCRLIELNVDVAPDGLGIIAHELRILGVTLSSIYLFTLQKAPQTEDTGMENRVLVHIPNDPLTPFKLYASLEVFQAGPRNRLWPPAYERFFCGFVSQHDLSGLLSRLRKLLTLETRNADGKVTTSLNQAADLRLKLEPLSGDLFFHRYRQRILQLQADARSVAVPAQAPVQGLPWPRIRARRAKRFG